MISNRQGTGKRIIGKEDGYNTIYNSYINQNQLRYFRKWNNRQIKGRDIDENLIFNDKDLLYIKYNLGN